MRAQSSDKQLNFKDIFRGNLRVRARTFIFARDPRDISVVYFFDPETLTYSPIPYLNNTRPAISLWELRAAVARLREDPVSHVDEEMIFQGIRKMREIEDAAVQKTRLAKQHRANEKRKRRMAERRNGPRCQASCRLS